MCMPIACTPVHLCVHALCLPALCLPASSCPLATCYAQGTLLQNASCEKSTELCSSAPQDSIEGANVPSCSEQPAGVRCITMTITGYDKLQTAGIWLALTVHAAPRCLQHRASSLLEPRHDRQAGGQAGAHSEARPACGQCVNACVHTHHAWWGALGSSWGATWHAWCALEAGPQSILHAPAKPQLGQASAYAIWQPSPSRKLISAVAPPISTSTVLGRHEMRCRLNNPIDGHGHKPLGMGMSGCKA